MNRFLDVHGVLDSDYEQTAQRTPVSLRCCSRPDADGPRRQRAGDHRFLEDPALQGSTTPPAAAPNQASVPAQSSAGRLA